MHLILALIAIAMCALGTSARPAAAADVQKIAYIGVPGLAWQDLSPERTPTLWQLAQQGSIADITVRATDTPSCPIDGWLTISKGDHATGGDPGCPLPRPPSADGIVPDWAEYRKVNEESTWGASIGWLTETVAAKGGCVSAAGAGAALAAADNSGLVSHYRPAPAQADFQSCPVSLVDVDEIAQPYAGDRKVSAAERAKAVAAADTQVRLALDQIPRTTTTLVSAVSDVGHDAHLRPAITAGGSPRTYLDSASTRRPGLVKLTDVPSTLLMGAGITVPPGTPDPVWRPSEDPAGADAVHEMIMQDAAARTVAGLAPLVFITLVGGQLVAYGLLALAMRFSARRPATTTVAGVIAIAFASAPAGMFLVNLLPWPELADPAAGLLVGILLITAAVAGLALAAPRSRRSFLPPVIVVSAITSITIAIDTVTGYNLQYNSFLGLYPINAGRLFGLGNEGFAVFVVGTMLALAGLGASLNAGGRRLAGTAVAVGLGIVAVAVVGAPDWGANFGGTLSLIPGVAALGVLVSRTRITFSRLAAAVAISLVVVFGISYLDSLRPSSVRSHFGDFWANLLAGNGWTVVLRKLESMLDSLGSAWITLLVTVPIMAVVLVVLSGGSRTPQSLREAFTRAPALQWGLLAAWFTVAIGFLVNDSGPSVPGLALLIGAPLALYACARVSRETWQTE